MLLRLPRLRYNFHALSKREMSNKMRAGSISSTPSTRPPFYDDKPHHTANSAGFNNPWPSWAGMATPANFMVAGLQGKIRPEEPPALPEIKARLNFEKVDFSKLETAKANALKAVWLGHAASFLEFPRRAQESRGIRVLMDPVFSKRCSPVGFMGPARYVEAPTSVATLPGELDIVLISHNHYDHLDVNVMKEIFKKYGRSVTFVCPLELGYFFRDLGISQEQIHEMDWWDECIYSKNTHDGISLSAKIGYLPAQHMTARGLFDKSKTLWGSYAIENFPSDQGQSTVDVKKVWFAGDTGRRTIPFALEHSPTEPLSTDLKKQLDALPVCPAHVDIGTYRGPFDLAIIPIGAYAPRYLMSPVHVDPEEACEIFREVKASRAYAIHWGTWALSKEGFFEASEELEKLKSSPGNQDLQSFEVWGVGKIMEV